MLKEVCPKQKFWARFDAGNFKSRTSEALDLVLRVLGERLAMIELPQDWSQRENALHTPSSELLRCEARPKNRQPCFEIASGQSLCPSSRVRLRSSVRPGLV